jgi:hypothetical protein
MKPPLVLLVLMILLYPALVQAHLGSPDVFYDGTVGSWPTRVTIRMPAVVPGRAEIVVQVQSREPVTVTFVPISSRTAVSNAPPAELAEPVRGETNLFTGGLWLMTMGAYSIEVRIHGQSGEGTMQIPVNSVATAQLPLPPWLGKILAALGLILFCGAMAIVAAAAGESILPPGVLPGKTERRKYWIATIITGVVLSLALVGGKKWWDVEETNFRSRLHEGGWPDLASDVRVEGSRRILRLTLGKSAFANVDHLGLVPDHGKLLHLFLVGLPNHQAFGHIHPVRQGNTTFEVALPPLPEGDYELFCDLTLESGLSSTATNSIHLPPVPATTGTHSDLEPDVDDSWAVDSAVAVRENSGGDTVCRLADGTQVIWKAHPPLYAKQDAGLQFEVRDQTGQPVSLEPYMGMMSHAAVVRSDGRVFAHLHPSGNYSMAAQMFFDAKLAKETGATGSAAGMSGMDPSMMMDHSMMGQVIPPVERNSSIISLPYEFPTPGNYRVWVQFKTGGQITTAIFDASVT